MYCRGARPVRYLWAWLLHYRRRLTLLALVVLFLFSRLPWDSPVRSAVRWQFTTATDYYQQHHPTDSWWTTPAQYPVDVITDVRILIKTGYGTRRRVPKLLAALWNETFDADMIVLQDYPVLDNENYTLPGGKNIPVIDALGWMLHTGKLKGGAHSERVRKYQSLADAIVAEEWALSDGLSRYSGWELDSMKFISGLQYVWENMPRKKWYLLIDDDTYVIKSSLKLVLGHLDPRKPTYIGNPVGDFKARFGHGGSSVLISASAMSKLFDGHPDVVAEAHHLATTEVWGDKLLSTTLMKVGVYLDESYRRLFNGESPHLTRIRADRFCIPLVSFHGLGDGNVMDDVGNCFKSIVEPVYWRHLGSIYGADPVSFLATPTRVDHNFVGGLDDNSVTVNNVDRVEGCLKLCNNSRKCLAWVYGTEARVCHLAPWMIVGFQQPGVVSGINAVKAEEYASSCHSPPTPKRVQSQPE